MAVLDPKTRLVSFRLTNQEFEQLNLLCAAKGSRSLSDLTRTAVREVLRLHNPAKQTAAGDPNVRNEVDDLRQIVAALMERVGRLERSDACESPSGGELE